MPIRQTSACPSSLRYAQCRVCRGVRHARCNLFDDVCLAPEGTSVLCGVSQTLPDPHRSVDPDPRTKSRHFISDLRAMSASAQDSAAIARAKALFEATFDQSPTHAVAAPGRVNLIGEHTDYNDGFVFPLALEKNTYIVAAPTTGHCKLVSELFPDVVATITPGASPLDDSAPEWSNYVKGMTALYERAGHPVLPFLAAVVSDVPLGAGLSSSAALEMATGILLETLSGKPVDPSERARLGQSCEQQFAGVKCGIMDQLISSRGQAGRALFLDCRSLEAESVPLDHPDAVIVVADSKVKHQLVESEYNTRRQQCTDAAAAVAKKYPGVTHLRDCDMSMLESVKESLDDDTFRKATHAIEEDKRAEAAKEALKKGDLVTTGKLMHQSHVSLRDLYEVSTQEIDALVEMAMGVEGVYGSRITGGGFGGCTVTLVHRDAVDALMKVIEDDYPAVSGGKKAAVFATRAGKGARVVTDMLGV